MCDNIGFSEIALIVVIAFIVLGPEKIPEIARGIMKLLQLRSQIEKDFRETVKPIVEAAQSSAALAEKEPVTVSPAPAPEIKEVQSAQIKKTLDPNAPRRDPYTGILIPPKSQNAGEDKEDAKKENEEAAQSVSAEPKTEIDSKTQSAEGESKKA